MGVDYVELVEKSAEEPILWNSGTWTRVISLQGKGTTCLVVGMGCADMQVHGTAPWMWELEAVS